MEAKSGHDARAPNGALNRDNPNATRTLSRPFACLLNGITRCQRHAHASFRECLRFAEQAQIGIGNTQGVVQIFKRDFAVLPAINYGARTNIAARGVNGQAQNGAGVKVELALTLGAKRD